MGGKNVLEERVEGKEDKIKLLQEELKGKKDEIERLTEAHKQDLKSKDERIKELENLQVSQKDKEREDQKFLTTEALKTIREFASRPNSPTPSLGNEGEITRLREELDEKKQEFKEQLDEKKQELEEKKQEIKDLKVEIKGLKQEIKDLKTPQQIAQVESVSK